MVNKNKLWTAIINTWSFGFREC